ncbi:hypothetical protein M514_23572 [Trichuris suis]|uniref:Uncharacterized protein n=1 Tax=Trichuris suis TaxID=68888 RepID=A0A085N492_9BILA|nr:hypothetical protein M514_23572 [Trichuris suis]
MKLTVEGNGKAPRWRRRKAQCRTEVSLRTGRRAEAGLQDRYPAHILLEQRLLLNKILLQGVRQHRSYICRCKQLLSLIL